MTDLRNEINRKKNPEHENPKKVADIVEKLLDFNKQQKSKEPPSELVMRFKILTTKQMLERLSIAPAQVKAGNTIENLPNEIRQIICSLCREKEITKNVCNNIMNSVKL